MHILVPPWNAFWPKSRRKGGQVRFTTEQTNSLEARFDTEKYLSPNVRENHLNSKSKTNLQFLGSPEIGQKVRFIGETS